MHLILHGIHSFLLDFDMKKPPKCIPAVFSYGGSIQKASWLLYAEESFDRKTAVWKDSHDCGVTI